MAATANAMTLRVRANLIDHRTVNQNKANQSIARITIALAGNSIHPHLNGALQTMRNNFAAESAGVLQDLAAAGTVRKVEKAMMRLERARQAIRVDLVQEVTHIDPTSAPPADTNLGQYVLGLVANYHIGKSPRGRTARKQEKRALQSISALAGNVY